MKSSNEILFDFKNAIEQARKLEELAGSMDRRVAGKLDETAQTVHAAWKGDSAACYIGKTQELCRQVRQTAKVLRETAEDIRKIARRIYEAEMQALQIAQSRNS